MVLRTPQPQNPCQKWEHSCGILHIPTLIEWHACHSWKDSNFVWDFLLTREQEASFRLVTLPQLGNEGVYFWNKSLQEVYHRLYHSGTRFNQLKSRTRLILLWKKERKFTWLLKGEGISWNGESCISLSFFDNRKRHDCFMEGNLCHLCPPVIFYDYSQWLTV